MKGNFQIRTKKYDEIKKQYSYENTICVVLKKVLRKQERKFYCNN